MYGAIQLGIGTGLVCSDPNKIFGARVCSHQLAHERCLRPLCFANHRGHQSAYGIQHLNRWIYSVGGERAGEHDVPVQKRTNSIHDWILLIVPFHEHGVKRGYAPGLELSRSLHQPRQARKEQRECSPSPSPARPTLIPLHAPTWQNASANPTPAEHDGRQRRILRQLPWPPSPHACAVGATHLTLKPAPPLVCGPLCLNCFQGTPRLPVRVHPPGRRP